MFFVRLKKKKKKITCPISAVVSLSVCARAEGSFRHKPNSDVTKKSPA